MTRDTELIDTQDISDDVDSDSATVSVESAVTSSEAAKAEGASAAQAGPSVIEPLVPWVTVLIRYLGRPVVVTCLARAYLATLTFSATLDAVRFCAAGFLGPDKAYGVLEYQHGRWKQPMALQVVLRRDRRAVGGPREESRETFIAGCYPEEGWKFLAESVESLELVVDPNFD